jgi:Transposase zinc-binding domain/Putative transposase
MSRPALEVANIFRDHGAAWRRANVGHVSLDQIKVMSAIERCRTAALGGHVARCEDCPHTIIAYNSCRNRHCPKCQGTAAKQWLAAREADLLPVPYFHVVFTLLAAIADIAYQNKAVIYDILFTTSAETMTTIAADPKHLGARIGITSVLHTWGSALTHHPHVHMIVPGGGICLDGTRWVPCRPDFILPVEVLSCLFRGLFLAKLVAAHRAGRLKFFGVHAGLDNIRAFKAHQRRCAARHSRRFSPGSTPACADQQDWPVIPPQSARSRQHARPRFELKRSDRQRQLNFPNTHAEIHRAAQGSAGQHGAADAGYL